MPEPLSEAQYNKKYGIDFDPHIATFPSRKFRRTFKSLANAYGLGFTLHFRSNEFELRICIWNFLWSFYWDKPDSEA